MGDAYQAVHQGAAVSDPTNLLDDASAMRRGAAPVALGKRQRRSYHEREESDDDAEMLEGEDGRMIVRDEVEVAAEEAAAHDAAAAAAKAQRLLGGRRGKRQRRGDAGDRTAGGLEAAMKKRAVKGKGGGGKTGSAYASEKSGGDRQKKGQKLEPFAYIRLSSKYLSKRCVCLPRALARRAVRSHCVHRRSRLLFSSLHLRAPAHPSLPPFPPFPTAAISFLPPPLCSNKKESGDRWKGVIASRAKSGDIGDTLPRAARKKSQNKRKK